METTDIAFIKARYKENKKLYDETLKLIKLFNKFYKTLQPVELAVLKDYKEMAYWYINGVLRKDAQNNNKFTLYQIPKDTKCKGMDITLGNLRKYIQGLLIDTLQKILVLDDLFTRTPVTIEPITVFRGVSDMHDALSKLKKGGNFVFDNFLSTSLAVSVADKFASQSTQRDILVIKVPKGVPHMYLPWRMDELMNNQLFTDEFELLFPRGAVLKLVKKEIVEDYSVFKRKYKNVNVGDTNMVITFYHFVLNGFEPTRQLPNVDEILDNITSVEVFI